MLSSLDSYIDFVFTVFVAFVMTGLLLFMVGSVIAGAVVAFEGIKEYFQKKSEK